jgi:hypothetical protein
MRRGGTDRPERGAAMISIHDGRSCVGFVLRRGRSGFEAFSAAEKSLGMFASKDAAIGECFKTKVNKHE